MEQYNVRINLHGASQAIYDLLGGAMARLGGTVFVETQSGRLRRLRPGEFEMASDLDAHGVLRCVEGVVRAVWINSGIRVTGAKESCSCGEEPLPEAPADESRPRTVVLP